jgi:hypothetical protein
LFPIRLGIYFDGVSQRGESGCTEISEQL